MNAIIPDCCHIRRAHAEDIALEVVEACARRWVRLYLLPNGVVRIAHLGELDGGDAQSLVGTYTAQSTVAQIRDDILAMGRELIT
ncbi:MAG: hypothetical protein ABI972_31115 [Acidobacteriota bacterium]